MGLSGLDDGIVFHPILQWHLGAAERAATDESGEHGLGRALSRLHLEPDDVAVRAALALLVRKRPAGRSEHAMREPAAVRVERRGSRSRGCGSAMPSKANKASCYALCHALAMEQRSPRDFPFGVLAINRAGEFRLNWFRDQAEYLERTAKHTFMLFGPPVFIDHYGSTGRRSVDKSVVNLTGYHALSHQDARSLVAWLKKQELYALAWIGDVQEFLDTSANNVFLQACRDHLETLLGAPLTLELLKLREGAVIEAIKQLPKTKLFST